MPDGYQVIDYWQDEEAGSHLALYEGSLSGYYGCPEEGGHRWSIAGDPEIQARHAWLVRELACEQLKTARQGGLIAKLRADLAKCEEARDAYFEAIPAQKPDAQLARENDELARGILELQRKLTIAEKRTKHAEDRLQSAINVGEMWRGRHDQEKKARKETESAARAAEERFREEARHATNRYLARWKDLMEARGRAETLLPLGYFPAGEDPEARWGLTDLGQRALTGGWARGPEWTLLVSPDPREVLSIEVRAGSRQEEIYRTAGYVSAGKQVDVGRPSTLERGDRVRFTEVRAEDEDDIPAPLVRERELKLAQEIADLKALVALLEKKLAMRPSFPPYDLAAVCARCGQIYGDHVIPIGPMCDGFIAEQEASDAKS